MADITLEAGFQGRTLDEASDHGALFRHLGYWSDGREVFPRSSATTSRRSPASSPPTASGSSAGSRKTSCRATPNDRTGSQVSTESSRPTTRHRPSGGGSRPRCCRTGTRRPTGRPCWPPANPALVPMFPALQPRARPAPGARRRDQAGGDHPSLEHPHGNHPLDSNPGRAVPVLCEERPWSDRKVNTLAPEPTTAPGIGWPPPFVKITTAIPVPQCRGPRIRAISRRADEEGGSDGLR